MVKRKYSVEGIFCPNHDCQDYGKVGTNNLIHQRNYGKQDTRLLKCKSCGKTFSANKGTPFWGLRTKRNVVLQAIKCIVEGNGISATARIIGVKEETVLEWLRRMAEHVEAVNYYLIHDLHLSELEIDELWTFVKKKRKISRKKMILRHAENFGAGLPSASPPDSE